MAAPHPSLLGLVNGEGIPPDTVVTMTIAASAEEHGVAPLLDATIRDEGLGGDRDAVVRLAMRSLETTADTGAAQQALRHLVDRSNALGLEIAAFKGLTIGRRWYPQPELRPAVDVDVFINPGQSDRLGALVEALTDSAQSRTAVDAMVAEGRVFEVPLNIDGVAVDFHIDPFNMVVPMRQRSLLWERTELMHLADGQSVRVLDLELSVLQALLHLFRDNFADLLHIYDIGLMMDHGPDWDFIAATAETEGWTDIVREAVRFSCDVLSRPAPLRGPRSIGNRMLIGAIWPQRIRLKGADSLGRSDRRQSLASLLVQNRRADVMRAFRHRAFPPRTVIDERFPQASGSYVEALYRWRRAQRDEILQFRRNAAGSTDQHPGNPNGGRTEEAGHETN